MEQIYINDLRQSLPENGSNLYTNDTCILYQDKENKNQNKKIEDLLNKKLSTLLRWLVDNSLSIHSGEDKTKYILFSNTKGLSNLNISYADHITKQYNAEKFLECYLGSK